MTAVVDASVVVAGLIDLGDDGEWARRQLGADHLVAPDHLFVEVSNVLRRLVLARVVGPDAAALAHDDLVRLPVTTFAFEPLARRVWDLHPTVTAYDAAYVALAEELAVPLVTLDQRLSRASGPTCEFLLPA